jgi:adenylate cyclase
MATGDVKRKLTAIFSADVEGYSRLMEEDELATVETLTAHKEIMRKMIRQYRGRVVDSTGDNLLAEFTSVVDAVQCAVEVQQVLSSKNEPLPENRRMYFRIGINSGDVIEEGELIYGDGVNVAARVESLAEGGGISISGTAYDQLGKKLPLGYEYLGEQSVKNIEKPVRVYRILTEAEAAGKVIGEAKPKTKQLRWAAFGAMAVLIIVAGALAIWNFYFRPAFEPASVEKMAYQLPDKPSIAVLPFVNMSGDPEQEFLSDGIAESIITALSQTPNLFVIARNSTFSYKGKPVKIQQVSEELGVRYVMEGSVQKSGDQLRITAQLIDAITGQQLWAEQYDRDLKDLFALQDEITLKVLTALQVKLTMGEQARLRARGTKNVKAYLKFLKAMKYMLRYNRADNVMARQLAQEALTLDPNFADPYDLIGWTHLMDIYYGTSKSPGKSIKKAAELIQKALALNDSLPWTYTLLAYTYLMKRQHEKAIALYERAIELNPNVADVYGHFGMALNYVSRPEDAIASFEKAIRLNPIPPSYYLQNLGRSYRMVGRYEDSIATYKKVLDSTPNNMFALVGLTATYSLAGRLDEARAQGAEVLRVQSNFSAKSYVKKYPFQDKAETERLIDALLKAGLPEHPTLPLPDKPSIAVLPFVNMSGDPEQEYFSDGMTEQIITALSKSPDLFVISRSSTFTYKGKSVKAQQVSRDLGVRYVVEGSVQKAGDQVRITAQLIDAKTDHHLWAERYDRNLKDIFALQDEVILKIVSAVGAKLTSGERALIGAKGTENLDAYLKYMKSIDYFARGTPDDYARARRLAEEAIALDPEYPAPYGRLAWTHMMDAFLGTSKSPRQSMRRAFKLAKKSLAMDESDPDAHGVLGNFYLFSKEHEKAIAEFERSVTLNPNYARGFMYLGWALSLAGRPQEAIPSLKKSMRLNPLSKKHASMCLFRLGSAYRLMGQYEEALSALKKALNIRPNFFAIHLVLASTYIHLGREKEARAAAEEVLRIVPTFSLERYAKRVPFKNQEDTERVITALRKAGLK